jgi:hypothetical protein
MNETGPIPPYFGPLNRSAQTPPQPRPADGEPPTAVAAAVRPAGAPAAGATASSAAGPATAPERSDATTAHAMTAESPTVVGPAAGGSDAGSASGPVAAWALTDDSSSPGSAAASPGTFATTPVTSRPTVRARRRDPLTRMGPWAPAAGALLGLVAGLVVAVLLAGEADAFAQRMALVFLVVGLTMLGSAGALLADEVRIVRRGAREAVVRPSSVEATAGLLNGLTPARLLLASSAFVLFLAAYVGR